MSSRFQGLCWLGVLCLSAVHPLSAEPLQPLNDRTAELVKTLEHGELTVSESGKETHLPALGLHFRQCGAYPYNEPVRPRQAARILLADLREGLRSGLQCLIGQGPQGKLHPYHEYQAHRLLTLFESSQQKTFHCVEDAIFATAVATSPLGTRIDDALYPQLSKVRHPGVVFDTYRLGGLLSRRFDDETYRNFFHLEEAQIVEHRNGQPLRPAGLHRYKNRPGLIFHEIVHWLGHEHSAVRPDLAHLYETCCFGGSDYISDPDLNSTYQQTACAILKDDELWSQSINPYKQMRLWHYKNYDQLKPLMRADYDS